MKQVVAWSKRLESEDCWYAWLSVVAQTAQISIVECVKMYSVRSKADTLLSSFKLSKLHVFLLEMALLTQLKREYHGNKANQHIVIGNGLPLSRQPKLLKQCHTSVLAMAAEFMELNSSEQKKLTSRLTMRFDKSMCAWAED